MIPVGLKACSVAIRPPLLFHQFQSSSSGRRRLIKLCKTSRQLQELHAHTVTSSSFPRSQRHSPLFLTTLLRHACAATSSSSPDSPLVSYALTVFALTPTPTTFSYNLIICLHTTTLSSPTTALRLFVKMRRDSLLPDSHTFPFALKACSQLSSLSSSSSIHGDAIKFGLRHDLFVHNSLIHAYCASDQLYAAGTLIDESFFIDVVSQNILMDGLFNARDMVNARRLFDGMKVRDAISWGTLVGGCTRVGLNQEAMRVFCGMMASGFTPDAKTLVSAMTACTQMVDFRQGKTVHGFIQKKGVAAVNSFVCTALVDFYCKCGYVETAERVFECCVEKNLFAWNAMIFGLAMHGRGRESLEYFQRMVKEGKMEPDGVSLLGVLVGCSHAGMVEEARVVFGEMEGVYGVKREVQHYGCMADILGRAGLVKEAMEMAEGMPMRGDIFVYGGLLNGCRIHGDAEAAEWAAGRAMGMMFSENLKEDGIVSVISGVYAAKERWGDVVRMREWRERLKGAPAMSNYCARSLVEAE